MHKIIYQWTIEIQHVNMYIGENITSEYKIRKNIKAYIKKCQHKPKIKTQE